MIHLRGIALFALIASLLTCVACGNAPQTSSTTNSSQPSTNSNGSTGSTSGGSQTPPSPYPANAKTVSDIQKIANWSSCSSSCAGEKGTNAIYSNQEGITSPSLSGSAMQFNITGGTPWADSLWWKQIGGNDAATHFVYNISFYMKDVNAAQALEFNVNQNANGNRYEYATQCDIKGSHTWRIWDHTNMHWVGTTAPCPAPLQDAWNHLTWEFERNSQNQVVWKAVTLNGVRSDVNLSFDSFPGSGSGIDVAFQMDSDGGPTPWTVYVDSVSLTYW